MELDEHNKAEARQALQSVLNSQRKGPGRVVKTKSGLIGCTYNSEPPVNGKIKVFLPDGKNILCNPNNLQCIGFTD